MSQNNLMACTGCMRAADGNIWSDIESIFGNVASIYKKSTETPKPTNQDKADMDLEVGFGQSQQDRLIWGMSPVVFAGVAVLAGVLLIGIVYFATQSKK